AISPKARLMSPATDHFAGDDDRLIVFESATFARNEDEPLFEDFNWSVREGETWAIVGPIGSGKTTLAELILGRRHLQSGSIDWPLLDRLRARGRIVNWPRDVIGYVSFKEKSHPFSYARHYYQQRFNFIEPQDDLSLGDFLRSGNPASEEEIRQAADRLGIGGLLPLSLIKLSNGQMRRARIAHALLRHPEWMI